MTGRIQSKNGRYYAVINYSDCGKHKQKWIATGLPVKNNKRKAETMLPEIISDFEKTLTPLWGGEMSFTTYLCKWLQGRQQMLSPSTFYSYESILGRHILPFFEPLNLKLSEVKPTHIKLFYVQLVNTKRSDGKEGYLSQYTILSIEKVIKKALSDAFNEEIIAKNPASKIRPQFKANDEKTERTYLNVQTANELLQAFEGHWLQPIIYVTLYYGLRRSEVLGLKWNAIDFEQNTITIRHSVITYKHGVIAKDALKTQSSYHTYALIDDVKKVLLNVKKEQDSIKSEMGSFFVDQGYVFSQNDGAPRNPSHMRTTFSKMLELHNLPHMRFHDLRHSTASVLYDKGWSIKDIQTWLRHSNIATTSNIYTHITEDRKARMAHELNALFQMGGEQENGPQE